MHSTIKQIAIKNDCARSFFCVPQNFEIFLDRLWPGLRADVSYHEMWGNHIMAWNLVAWRNVPWSWSPFETVTLSQCLHFLISADWQCCISPNVLSISQNSVSGTSPWSVIFEYGIWPLRICSKPVMTKNRNTFENVVIIVPADNLALSVIRISVDTIIHKLCFCTPEVGIDIWMINVLQNILNSNATSVKIYIYRIGAFIHFYSPNVYHIMNRCSLLVHLAIHPSNGYQIWWMNS